MCVIWGIPYLLIKVGVGALTPASLVLVRTGQCGIRRWRTPALALTPLPLLPLALLTLALLTLALALLLLALLTLARLGTPCATGAAAATCIHLVVQAQGQGDPLAGDVDV